MIWIANLERSTLPMKNETEAPAKSGEEKIKLNFGSIILIVSSNSSTEGFTALIVNGIGWVKASNRCNT